MSFFTPRLRAKLSFRLLWIESFLRFRSVWFFYRYSSCWSRRDWYRFSFESWSYQIRGSKAYSLMPFTGHHHFLGLDLSLVLKVSSSFLFKHESFDPVFHELQLALCILLLKLTFQLVTPIFVDPPHLVVVSGGLIVSDYFTR
jgi:hypothetical protein